MSKYSLIRLLSAAALCALSPVSAQAADILSPMGSWALNADAQGGTERTCSLRSTYQGDAAIELVGEKGLMTGAAFTLPASKIQPGWNGEATLRLVPSGKTVKVPAATESNGTGLYTDLSKAPDFGTTLAGSAIMYLDVAGESHAFSMSGVKDVVRRLQSCRDTNWREMQKVYDFDAGPQSAAPVAEANTADAPAKPSSLKINPFPLAPAAAPASAPEKMAEVPPPAQPVELPAPALVPESEPAEAPKIAEAASAPVAAPAPAAPQIAEIAQDIKAETPPEQPVSVQVEAAPPPAVEPVAPVMPAAPKPQMKIADIVAQNAPPSVQAMMKNDPAFRKKVIGESVTAAPSAPVVAAPAAAPAPVELPVPQDAPADVPPANVKVAEIAEQAAPPSVQARMENDPAFEEKIIEESLNPSLPGPVPAQLDAPQPQPAEQTAPSNPKIDRPELVLAPQPEEAPAQPAPQEQESAEASSPPASPVPELPAPQKDAPQDKLEELKIPPAFNPPAVSAAEMEAQQKAQMNAAAANTDAAPVAEANSIPMAEVSVPASGVDMEANPAQRRQQLPTERFGINEVSTETPPGPVNRLAQKNEFGEKIYWMGNDAQNGTAAPPPAVEADALQKPVNAQDMEAQQMASLADSAIPPDVAPSAPAPRPVPVSAPAPAPAAIPTPTPAPAPVATSAPAQAPVVEDKWQAVRGANLREVLALWCVEDGVQLIWDIDTQFSVVETINTDDSFEKAVAKLLDQFSMATTPQRPVGEMFHDPESGERVLVVRAASS